MERIIKVSAQYKKDYVKAQKQGLKIEKLKFVIEELQKGNTLDKKYHDHSLIGKYNDCRECHIEPDWLLIYRISLNNLELILLRTGSHSNLF